MNMSTKDRNSCMFLMLHPLHPLLNTLFLSSSLVFFLLQLSLFSKESLAFFSQPPSSPLNNNSSK